ncbi:hypothetical protein SMACR_07691 [Sordaria macrospora]|uniref:WGS project CABT00000000 data, contig 2.27 n=2 Tax=Sordaria macrospora TaxID=5147 RepID=F7W4F9_SORMK|nr:uncharacterized protein SMAC_07691 [Sordaria macrospora k-hell]KAA8634878.1 hypothetical protein SMACR_07691 [Sordaria macrospora]WPJ67411.1 hypothetical protein SMAC4_07691 [Sordaria macrospora]CCC14912.1 unnamed protein product [Sordaria macrospora k-hell]
MTSSTPSPLSPQSSEEDLAALAKYIGQVVPFHISPGIIVLSYIISLCGAISTLELMNRRTSSKGLYNHLLLIGAAISLGGVSIWCMHYIGNRAIILHHGEVSLQVVYDAGITAASFFVPIVVLLSAFFITANTTLITWWRILLSGALSGGATCGMHYLGSAAIRNYKCSYETGYVVGATVIAVFVNTAVLALFFVSKALWTNSWWKRLGCAVVLSGSVSGMHWCAAVGTRYRLQNLENVRNMVGHNATIIVVPFLAISSCLVMAGVAIHSSRIRKVYASKAQKITLAAAIFDEHGRILVTPDGNLPSEEITTTFLQKTQHDIFSTGHPLFHWIYQASRDWYLISKMVDKMDRHLASLPHSPSSHSRKARMGIEFIDEEGKIIEDYDVIFREMFCLATVDLSAKVNMSLDEAGVLWDEILTTGGTLPGGSGSGIHSPGYGEHNSSKRNSDFSGHGGSGLDKKGSTSTMTTSTTMTASASAVEMAAQKNMKNWEDLAEKGMVHTGDHGHGSLMFLVKRVQGSHAVDKLEASGHTFADLHQVCRIMNNSMQIRTGKLEEKLRSMERYTYDAMLEPGVHVGLFAIRARVDVQQFDVMVRKEARGLLPSVKLPIERLSSSDFAFLRRHDGLSISYFLKRFRHSEDIPQQDTKIAQILYEAIKDLRSLVDDTLFDEATLVAKVSQVPCKSPDNDSRAITCSMLAFCMMIPIHKSVNCAEFEFTPLPFFKVRQLAYKNSPYHAAFARSVHREIYPILNDFPTTTTTVDKRRVPAWSSSWLPSLVSMPIFHLWRRPNHQSHDLHPWRHQREDMDSSSLVYSTKEHVRQPSSHRSISTHSLDVYSTINSDDNKGGTQIQLQPQSSLQLSPLTLPSPGSAQQQGQQTPGSAIAPTGELMTCPMTLHLYSPREKPQQLSYGGIMISQEVSVSVDDSAPAVTISSGSHGRSPPHTPPGHRCHHHTHSNNHHVLHNHRHGNHQHSRSAGGAFDLQMLHGGKKRRFLSNQRARSRSRSRSRSGSMGAGLTLSTTNPTSPRSHGNPNRRSSCPPDYIDPLNPLNLELLSDHQLPEECVIDHYAHNYNHTVRHGLGQGLGQLGHLSPPQTSSTRRLGSNMLNFPPPDPSIHSAPGSAKFDCSSSSQQQQSADEPGPASPKSQTDFGLALGPSSPTSPPSTSISSNRPRTAPGSQAGLQLQPLGSVLSFSQALENPLSAGGSSAGYSRCNGGYNGVSASVLGLGASKVEVKKERDVVMTFVDDLFSVCVNNSGNGPGSSGGGAGGISSGIGLGLGGMGMGMMGGEERERERGWRR